MRTHLVTIATLICLTPMAAAESPGLGLPYPGGLAVVVPGQTVTGDLYLTSGFSAAFQVYGNWQLQTLRVDLPAPFPTAPSLLTIAPLDPTFSALASAPGAVTLSFNGTTALERPGGVIGTWSWTPGLDLVGGEYRLIGTMFTGELRRDGQILPLTGWGGSSPLLIVVPSPSTASLFAAAALSHAARRRRPR
jgi:hypothetical protein